MKELKDICKNYGLKNVVKHTIQPEDKEIIKFFANGVPNAFEAYKKNSNINRTFIKTKYKEKRKTRA